MIGCADHGCVFEKPKGMGTNGGCQCFDKIQMHPEDRRRLREKIKALRDERDLERARLIKMRRDTIEECAQEAGRFSEHSGLKIAMKIRALIPTEPVKEEK